MQMANILLQMMHSWRYSLQGYQKSVTSVVIPATIKINEQNYKVTGIKANALKSNKKVKKLTVGENVRVIGKKAFYGCKNLKSINH